VRLLSLGWGEPGFCAAGLRNALWSVKGGQVSHTPACTWASWGGCLRFGIAGVRELACGMLSSFPSWAPGLCAPPAASGVSAGTWGCPAWAGSPQPAPRPAHTPCVVVQFSITFSHPVRGESWLGPGSVDRNESRECKFPPGHRLP